jgi:hypothetical protein
MPDKAAPAAPVEATLKRGLRMSWFATKADHYEVGLAYEKSRDVSASMRPLGQLVGVIYDVESREFKNKNPDTGEDEVVQTLVAVGDFEVVRYADGEVASTASFGLPRYYLETAKAALAKGADRNLGLEFAIEIVLVPTGKQVPTTYEVRNLIPREVDSPINRLKARVQQTGRLRLPPPTTAHLLDAPGDVIEGEVVGASDADASGGGDADGLATSAAPTKGRAKVNAE